MARKILIGFIPDRRERRPKMSHTTWLWRIYDSASEVLDAPF